MTTTAQDSSLTEAAHLAWASRAQFEESNRINSFRVQMFRKMKVRREDFEVLTDLFPEEWEPGLRIGCEFDGQLFCLNKQHELSVVAWRCAKKGCETVIRTPISDFVSLGRALAYGAFTAERHPYCEAHKK